MLDKDLYRFGPLIELVYLNLKKFEYIHLKFNFRSQYKIVKIYLKPQPEFITKKRLYSRQLNFMIPGSS